MNSSCSPFSAEHALSQFAPLFLHFMLSCTLFSQHSSCFYLSLSIFSIHDPLQILSLCMTLCSYPSPARPNIYFKPWKSILGRVLYRERSYGCVRKGSVLFPWGAMGSLWWRLQHWGNLMHIRCTPLLPKPPTPPAGSYLSPSCRGWEAECCSFLQGEKEIRDFPTTHSYADQKRGSSSTVAGGRGYSRRIQLKNTKDEMVHQRKRLV